MLRAMCYVPTCYVLRAGRAVYRTSHMAHGTSHVAHGTFAREFDAPYATGPWSFFHGSNAFFTPSSAGASCG